MVDHVLKIRKKVGDDEILVWPTVSVFLFNAEGAVLMLYHPNAEYWSTPGGYVELFEDPKKAAIRELKEETNIDIEDLQLLNVYGGSEFCLIYKNGHQVSMTNIAYTASIQDSKILKLNTDEVTEYKFFTQGEIPNLNAPDWLKIMVLDAFEANN